MINGLIAIIGTILGFVCGYILAQVRKKEDEAPDMPSPIIAEKKLEVETITTKCEFPSHLYTKEEMIKHLCYGFTDEIFKNSALLVDYYVEEDYLRRNVSVARGKIKVVKNI